MKMNKKSFKNKSGESFSLGIVVILLSITIFTFAFMSEENKITGFATVNTDFSNIPIQNNLIEYRDINSLATLSPGNYYVDGEGIVYWLDDESTPAIAKVNFADEIQKNRYIYIDASGRVGYVLESVLITENR